MPESADIYLPNLKDNGIPDGEYAWTLQTYLRLRESGFPCELTGTMPREGIVLVHHNTLPYDFKPGAKLLVVFLKADKPSRPYAQLHIVQNTAETKLVENSYYIQHWPQPGLIPRDPARGDRFETIAFFGTGGNLAPEFLDPSWRKQLADMGLQWIFKRRPEWNDFSDVDAVLAVRSFPQRTTDSLKKSLGAWKPPTKLYNAWIAGVPAILAPEPAFQDQRRSELDYIEVTSVEEVLEAIARLRDDKKLCQSMRDNGRQRAESIQYANIVKQWQDFLTDIAVPTYEDWCQASNWSKQLFFLRQSLKLKGNRIRQILTGKDL